MNKKIKSKSKLEGIKSGRTSLPANYLGDLFGLQGKVAVVTGAGRGTGRVIAQGLLEAGASVILVDLNEKNLIESSAAFRGRKLAAAHYCCDLSCHDQIAGLVEFVTRQFGRIDILVNNAGVTFGADILEYPSDLWARTFAVNLEAPFKLAQQFGQMMKNQGNGSIINITSIGAELGFPNNPAYVASKGGLKQLTKALAVDLGKFGIRVNNIGPGYFKTDMTKGSWDNPELRAERTRRTILNRWGESQDIVGLIIFLASEASSYITGQDIYVDGGWLAKGL